jgi:hypothetical protein
MNFLGALNSSNVNKKNIEATEGMMASPNANSSMTGGRRRKSRKASKKSRKASKKSRKVSKKSRKGSKKSRKGSKKSRKGARRH